MPLPSGKVKMLGHFLDAKNPPNRRSRPNLKREVERDKKKQVIPSKSQQQQQQQARGTKGFNPRFGNPTKELLHPRC
jgi:hypothetical protein